MKLSDYVIDYIVSKKVGHIFEVCGGSITHLLDSTYKRKDIKMVSMHHEQAASFAAEGYARASGGIAVAMATSGPGATNMITGIGSCFFDSIPCIFITGQVNTYEFKFKNPSRQIGFQEADIVNIVKPIVKEAVLLTDSKKIRYYLEKLVYVAKSGRPGPVLLDIPMNIQREEINPDKLELFSPRQVGINRVLSGKIHKIGEVLTASKRPVILVGGGARSSDAQTKLLALIKKTGIPVVTSLMGLDSVPHENPSFVGMIGTYGNRYANLTLANADFILALGTRLDTRQTGTNPKTFARAAKIAHVDIDVFELNNKILADYPVCADVGVFLKMLNSKMKNYNKDKIRAWVKKVEDYKQKYSNVIKAKGGAVNPNYLIHELSQYIPDNAIVCADVGQNQMWAAQSIKLRKGQHFLTQGGMASMGSSLPMGIGASFASPGKVVVVISGDGGFQLNIQELQTLYHYKLPIKIVLLNNNCYGMVRQFQEQYFNCRYQSTVLGYSSPDFQKVARAYNIHSITVNNVKHLKTSLEKLFSNLKPGFLEVKIGKYEKTLPKLSVGRPIEDQEPFLSREEHKTVMVIKD